VVGFRIDRTGNLLSSWLEENSGIPALDNEALALIERAKPFPAPPAELNEDALRFTIPIVFGPHPPTGEAWNDKAVRAKMRSICCGC
jgi:periplasmic protein TonB